MGKKIPKNCNICTLPAPLRLHHIATLAIIKNFQSFGQMRPKYDVWDISLHTRDITDEKPFQQDQLCQIPWWLGAAAPKTSLNSFALVNALIIILSLSSRSFLDDLWFILLVSNKVQDFIFSIFLCLLFVFIESTLLILLMVSLYFKQNWFQTILRITRRRGGNSWLGHKRNENWEEFLRLDWAQPLKNSWEAESLFAA